MLVVVQYEYGCMIIYLFIAINFFTQGLILSFANKGAVGKHETKNGTKKGLIYGL